MTQLIKGFADFYADAVRLGFSTYDVGTWLGAMSFGVLILAATFVGVKMLRR